MSILSDEYIDEILSESRELGKEVERLRGVCKDKTTLLKDAYADNERLLAALGQICVAYRDDADANEMAEIASHALEP